MRDLAALLKGARLHLGLTRDSLSLVHMPSRWQHKAAPLLDAPLAGPAELAALLAASLAGGRFAGLKLAVTLGDDCVRLFMVPPLRNAAGMQDIKAAAAMRFHKLYGDDPAAWIIECDPSASRPFLACAMPSALHSAIRAVAQNNRLRLTRITPLFVLCWNQVCNHLGQAWLGVVQGGSITLGCVSSGDLAVVHRLHPPAGADSVWLRQQLRAAALRFGLEEPAEVKLFGGTLPGLTLPDKGDGLSLTRLSPPPRRPIERKVFIPLLGERRGAG